MKKTSDLQALPENSFSPFSPVTLDTRALLGRWVNTHKSTQNITEVILMRRDKALYLRVVSVAEPRDWGEIRVQNLFADAGQSHCAISFTARYDFDFLQTELQANVNSGLLIITSLNRFKDKRNKSDYFCREYFYREPAVKAALLDPPVACPRGEGETEQALRAVPKLDHKLFFGEWHNTDAGSIGICRVVFVDRDGSLTLRVFARGKSEPVDLGETEVRVFADSADSIEGTKFAADFDLSFIRISMHGWVKLGVLVISLFNQYTDKSGRRDFFNREFFYPVESIPKAFEV